ncbi:MAG: TIGR01244 family sulfur transferase, partial [Pseudomonadota bacterium]
IESAAEALGLRVIHIPVIHPTQECVDAQRLAIDAAEGVVLAYCRSGTRSITVWALSQAGQMPADAILQTATEAGYDLSGLRGYLESMGG